MNRRNLDISIISDVHLGTYECHAKELLNYLKSIQPKMLIINGDFIDANQFRKNNIPKEHARVIQEVLSLATLGTKVYYLTGNREIALKKFSEFSTATINLRESMVLQLKGQRYWVFHGDVFDPLFNVSPLISRIGIYAYLLLLRSNRLYNKWRLRAGKARMSVAGKMKTKMKKSLKVINEFEETAVQLARQQNYDFVICGHIHKPVIKTFDNNDSPVTYMNSGDWVENLTALEYRFGSWDLYKYDDLDYKFISPKLHVKSSKSPKNLPKRLLLKVLDQLLNPNKGEILKIK